MDVRRLLVALLILSSTTSERSLEIELPRVLVLRRGRVHSLHRLGIESVVTLSVTGAEVLCVDRRRRILNGRWRYVVGLWVDREVVHPCSVVLLHHCRRNGLSSSVSR